MLVPHARAPSMTSAETTMPTTKGHAQVSAGHLYFSSSPLSLLESNRMCKQVMFGAPSQAFILPC